MPGFMGEWPYGVEGNFAVVRAGQDGLLTLSDSRGKFIAQAATRYHPDAAMLIGEVPFGSGNSLYSKIGDWFVWLGIMFLAIMLTVAMLDSIKQKFCKK